MTENDPQQTQPGVVPEAGEPTSQQDAAAVGSLDSMNLTRNPLTVPQGGQDRDWENSFKGLMKTYQKEKDEWSQQRGKYDQAFQSMESRLMALEKPPAPAPVSQGAPPVPEPTQQVPEQDDSNLRDYMAEADAERFKLKTILEYAQPGQLGYGLPLGTFVDAITTIAPVLKDDGTVDDSGQRKEIEKVIGALKGLTGQTQQSTQQAMTAGYTPGVSPGAPQEPTAADLEAEYYRLKELYGSAELEKMPETEQNRVRNRYYELHELVGKGLPFQTTPFMDRDQIGRNLNDLLARVGILESSVTKR